MPHPSPTAPPPRLSEWMRSPVRAVPVTVLLLALNVAVFVMMALAGGALWHITPGVPLAWGANFGPATQSGEWWRLLSAVFVHFSLVHIGVNLWALWDVGRLMERVLGRWRYIALFTGAGAAGNLLTLAAQGGLHVAGGASGAIFGLYGALMVFLWTERQQLDPDEYRWMFTGALAFSALMLGLGFFLPGIDNAAHGGGLVAGALLGKLLLPPAQGRTGAPRSIPRSWLGALTAAVLATIYAGMAPPPYRYEEERNTRAAIEKFMRQDQAISARWQALEAQRGAMSFDQIAGALDREVAASYQRNFEELASVRANTAVPSHDTLVQLQDYAATRQAAAREAAAALRSRNPNKAPRPLDRSDHASPP